MFRVARSERPRRQPYAAAPPDVGNVLIRIIKFVPAPLMDGFDVRGFHVERIYDVDNRLGRYLIIAGYAEPSDDKAHDKSKPRRTR
jgi:hypothetical protein